MQKITTIQRFLIPIAILILAAAGTQAFIESSDKISTVDDDIQSQAKSNLQLLTATQQLMNNQVQAAMHMLRRDAQRIGLPAIDGSTVLNGQRIPNLVFGDQPQTNTSDLVDQVMIVSGGTATFFVKSGDDFIRVATSVRQMDGTRAIGTLLDPNGKPMDALRSGKSYYGIVDILGKPYITAYEPMNDTQGKLIGIWYVGFEGDLEALQAAIKNTRILKNGFAALLDEHHRVRFASSHVNKTNVQYLINERPSSWKFITTAIPEWGFKIIYAYPRKEAVLEGLTKASYVLLTGLVILAALSFLVKSQLKRLVLRPIGGDPQQAAALVKKIAEGNFYDDGMRANEDSLIADMLKMRRNLREMVDTLKSNAQRLSLAASVFEHASDGIFIADANIHIIQVNPAFERITGYTAQETLGKTPQELSFAVPDAKALLELIYSVKMDGHWRGELQNRKKSGEQYVIALDVSIVKDEHDRISHYVGMFSDTTLMKLQRESLQHMAYHDVLTQLPNRALFADRLKQALARVPRTHEVIAVCYMDLNGFKPINDTLGHDAGDELLVKLSMRLKESLRSNDTVARLGGDEFALLLCNMKSEAEARYTLHRILENLRQPYEVKGQMVQVSASAGMVIAPDPQSDIEMILVHADECMYLAKMNRDQEFFVYEAEAPAISLSASHN